MQSKFVIIDKSKKYKFSHFGCDCLCFRKAGGMHSEELDGIKRLFELIELESKDGMVDFISLDDDDIISDDADLSDNNFVLDGDEEFGQVRLLKLNLTFNDLIICKEIVDIRYEEIIESND